MEQAETYLKGYPAVKGDLPARVDPRREWAAALVWCNDATVHIVPVTLTQLSELQLSVLKNMFHVAEIGAELIPVLFEAIKTFWQDAQSSPQDRLEEERQEVGGCRGPGDRDASADQFIKLLRRSGGMDYRRIMGAT